MEQDKIEGTAEAWEGGQLGRDEAYVKKAAPELAQQVDDALNLQMISIRLPKELIDEFKMIARYHGLGYQPLMRDALSRFAKAELKTMAIQEYNNKIAKEQALAKGNDEGMASCTVGKKVA